MTSTEDAEVTANGQRVKYNDSGGKGDNENLNLKSPVHHESESLLSLDEVDALPKNAQYSNFDFFCTVVSIATYVFDMVMDIVVAVYFYHLAVTHGIYHYWYFGLTVTFILLPSLTMTGFSFRWYLMDADNEDLPEVPLWRWVLRLVVLMLQVAPVLRYFDSMRTGIKSRYFDYKANRARDPEERAKLKEKSRANYVLMVYEDSDATLLRLFECFMESAPQLVLQLYILLKDPHAIQLTDKDIVEDTKENLIIKSSIFVVSVISSLVSLAWSLVVYHRSLRYTYAQKKNLNFSGSLLQFLWHFSSITARVLALSLFASIYPRLIMVVCAAHWVLMSAWVMAQNTGVCNTKVEELLFSLVLGAIYIFSFFNAKEERTRYKYLAYYAFCFVENTCLIVFWFLYANEGLLEGQIHWYYYPGIVGHYVMFFAGVAFMVLYYGFFHPTGVKVDWQRLTRGKKKKGTDSVAPNEAGAEPAGPKPTFIDLREFKNEEEEGENLSRSTPALDEADGGGGCLDDSALDSSKHPIVKRTSSAPTSAIIVVQNPRSFKTMGNHHK